MLLRALVFTLGSLLLACGPDSSPPVQKKTRTSNTDNNNNGNGNGNGNGSGAEQGCAAYCGWADECGSEDAGPSCENECQETEAELAGLFGAACGTARQEALTCIGGLTCTPTSNEASACEQKVDDYLYACATSNCQNVADKLIACDTFPAFTSPLDYMYFLVDTDDDGQADTLGFTYCGMVDPSATPCDAAYDALFACLAAASCSDLENFFDDENTTVCAAQEAALFSACG